MPSQSSVTSPVAASPREASSSAPGRSRWRSALDRWTSSQEQVHAAQEQARSSELGGTPCKALSGRQRVTLVGALRSVTLRPRAGVPALEAELFDGSGCVTVIWLGRREIGGITTGRRIRVEGLVAVQNGSAVLYNPRYQLLAGADA